MSRLPGPAPDLPGYEYIRHLGGGGFADVFLYRQISLDRKVAVKVLLESASTKSARARFKNEGALMAQLSEAHENIVRVYDAAIGADGRPHLVMEYCPPPDLAIRYKSGPLTIAEVLSTGIQLAGAVESAHRQGILHRDIKPANVLTTARGKPALTDFGIAVTAADAGDPDAIGVSIPWSPPELLAANPVGDVRSDVYSLAATLYTLLAGRSPFEAPGRGNTLSDLLARIPRMPAPTTGRGDTPVALERVLSRGLAKDPALRFASAAELARALQQVQREIGGQITDLDLLTPNAETERAQLPPEAADHTRIRPLVINAQAPVEPDRSTRMRGATRVGSAAPDHTVLRGPRATGDYLDVPPPASAPAADTVVPPRPFAPLTAAPKRRSLRPVSLAVGGATLVAAGVLTWIVVSGGTDLPGPASPSTSGPETTNLAVDSAADEAVVPAPVDVTGSVTPDGVTFTWSIPDPRPGDSYSWTRTDAGAAGTASQVQAPPVTVPGVRQACIAVELVRENGRPSAHPAQACVGGG